jgi:hypothetical protein
VRGYRDMLVYVSVCRVYVSVYVSVYVYMLVYIVVYSSIWVCLPPSICVLLPACRRRGSTA